MRSPPLQPDGAPRRYTLRINSASKEALQVRSTPNRPRRILWIAPALLALLSPIAALAQDLNNQIEILLSHAQLGSSRVGVFIQDVDSGETLGAVNETESFMPASNMKLITTGAALTVLGPEFAFRTELRRAGDTLMVIGSGDPAMGDPVLLSDMQISVEDLLDQWVDATRRSGDTPPTSLVVDARVFDRQMVHPSWPVEQLNRWYAAEVSGLNFYTNVLSFYLSKRSLNEPPGLTLEPTVPWIHVDNRARSVNRGQNTVWVARPASSNAMTIYGNLRQSLHSPIRVALHDPPTFFGNLLAKRIEAARLGLLTVRLAEADEILPAGELLAVVQTPMSTVLRRCNVDSQNLYAEALLKRIGHDVTSLPGSFANGSAVIRMVLQDTLGPADTSTVLIADGSGLSRENSVTPRTMGHWLRALANDPELSEPFLASLAQAGKDGTLARRFRNTDLLNTVQAKSGYIRGVSCLSGYITDPRNGHRLAFSILVNDIPQQKVPIARVKEFHEAVVRIADGWLSENRGAVVNAPSADGLGG